MNSVFRHDSASVASGYDGSTDPESATGDPHLAAEHVLAHVGLGALMSGTADGTLSVEGARVAKRKIREPFPPPGGGPDANEPRAFPGDSHAKAVAAVGTTVRANRKAIERSISRFLGDPPENVPPDPETERPNPPDFMGDPAVPESRSARRERQQGGLRRLQGDLGELVERFAGATQELHGALPHLAFALQARGKAGLDFLLSKASPPAPGLPGEAPVPPSDAELARWTRYVRAVERPLSVIDGLARGRLSPEGMETLGSVYPRLFAEMQQLLLLRVCDRVAETRKPLSYPQRRALADFLGGPVDALTAPAFGFKSQAAFVPSPTPPARAGRRSIPPGRGGRGLMTLQTPNQRLENH